MTARTRTEAACLQAAERDIRTAAMTGTLDRIWRDAEQTPAMQFLKRNEAAIDASSATADRRGVGMMADTQHTPGPWSEGQTSCYETALVGRGGAVVAYAAWDGGSGCHLEIENPADASLIAAAPDLLEVAKRLLERGYVSEHISEEQEDHKALVDAIAKAECRP